MSQGPVAFELPELELDELPDAVPEADDVFELELTVDPELVLDPAVDAVLELLLELESLPFWKRIVPVVVGLVPCGVQRMALPETHDA
jgi:hypothetical protein